MNKNENFKNNEITNISIKDMLDMSYALWKENEDKWSPMEAEHGRTFILYMIEEVGEVISILKKKGEDEIMHSPQIRERFIEEMCDVMMYYTDTLNRFGVSSEEFSKVYQKKFEKNMKRDYVQDHADS